MSNPEPAHGHDLAIQRLTQPDEAQLQGLAELFIELASGLFRGHHGFFAEQRLNLVRFDAR